MTLKQALAWADKNSAPEAVARLASRAAVSRLANEVRSLQEWIREEDERGNVCTKKILGEVCSYCKCGKK